MGVLQNRNYAVIRQLIGRIYEALHGLRVNPVLYGGRVGAACRVAHVERNRRSLCIKTRFELDRSLRAVAALADFLFARPDELHRLADDLRNGNGLSDFVRTQSAAE